MTSGRTSYGPLAGRQIVVTRALGQAGALSERLTALGATVLALPSIEIVATDSDELDQALRQLTSYDWLLFSSQNAVDIVFDRVDALGLDVVDLAEVSIGAVGRSTAERVRQRGGEVAFVPDEFVAEALVDGLVADGIAGKRVLLPRARVAREAIPDGLRAAGALVDVVVVYDNRKPEIDAKVVRCVQRGDVDCITFASQSAVRHVVDALGTIPPANVKVACIGPVTAAAACEAGMRVDILAEEYSIDGLVSALVHALGVGMKEEVDLA